MIGKDQGVAAALISVLSRRIAKPDES
jgi:hypothetical protein